MANQPILLRRFLAGLVDFAILGVIMTVLIFFLSFVFSMAAGHWGIDQEFLEAIQNGTGDPAELLLGHAPGLMMLAVLIIVMTTLLLLVGHGYFVYHEFRHATTPGKRLFNLKVASLDGQKLKLSQAFYRDIGRWYVDGMFVLPAILSIALTSRRQRVGDLMAKTEVVDSGAVSVGGVAGAMGAAQ